MREREFTITDETIGRIDAQNPRVAQVMTSLIHHLHDFIRDVQLTEKEWMDAIQFLTQAGKICTDKRQEFILLSDTQGVSIQVDANNNRLPEDATPQTVLGPYYWEGAPEVPMGSDIARGIVGEPCFYHGNVTTLGGQPIKGVVLDIWSGDGEGNYDMQLDTDEMRARGKLVTGEDGKYWFRSIKPYYYPVPTDGPVGGLLEAMGRHPNRPGHMHFILRADGYKSVVTHIFPSDTPYLDSDTVFGVKDGLIVDYQRHEPGIAPTGEKMDVPFHTCEYHFKLATLDQMQQPKAA